MVIGWCGGGNAGLNNYIKKKNIDPKFFDLPRLLGNFEKEGDAAKEFEFQGEIYTIHFQSSWETYGDAKGGEDLQAICKSDIPFLVTRKYSLAYEDSIDETEYHQGPSGCEAYLLKNTALAECIYDIM